MGDYGYLSFSTNATLDNATVTLGGASDTIEESVFSTNSSLILGPALTVNQTGSSALIEIYGYYGWTALIDNKGAINAESSVAGATLQINVQKFENEGTITVSNGDAFSIDNSYAYGSESFDNAATGVITVGAGSSLTLGLVGQTFSVTNEGTITANHATIEIADYSDFTNTGTLSINNSTVALGGTFTTAQIAQDLATIGGVGNSVGIDGSVNNAGATLDVGVGTSLGVATLGSTGTITGGTIVDSGSGLKFQGGTLSGVTYDGVMDMSASGASVTVAGGLTLAGASGTGSGGIAMGDNGSLSLSSNTTFDNATVILGGIGDTIDQSTSYAAYAANGYSAVNLTLTLGAGLVVDQTGDAAGASAIIEGGGYYGAVTLDNKGAINATSAVANASLLISVSNFKNEGTITVSNGEAFGIDANASSSDSFDNAATGVITVGAGSILTLGSLGTPFIMTNEGTITANGATVQIADFADLANTGTLSINASRIGFGGAYTAAQLAQNLTTIGGAGNSVAIDGALNNAGATLDVGAGTAFGVVSLGAAGTIAGGTVADSGSGLAFNGGTLDGVNYDGVMDMTASGSTVYVADGLTVGVAGSAAPGAINLGADGAIFFEDAQTFDNAVITLAGANETIDQETSYAAYQANGYSTVAQTLEFGANATIDQTSGSATIGTTATGGSYGYGAVAAVSAQSSLSGSGSPGSGTGTYSYAYGATTLDNEGTIDAAANNGSLSISPNSEFLNNGTVKVENGDTLDVLAPTFVNNGSVAIDSGIVLVTATTSGTGAFSIGAGVLEFDSGVASADQVKFTGSQGLLQLTDSAQFAAQVAGMLGNDAIDFRDVAFASANQASYAGTAAGGTLSLADGAAMVSIALAGNYTGAAFFAASDGLGGTMVSFGATPTAHPILLGAPTVVTPPTTPSL